MEVLLTVKQRRAAFYPSASVMARMRRLSITGESFSRNSVQPVTTLQIRQHPARVPVTWERWKPGNASSGKITAPSLTASEMELRKGCHSLKIFYRQIKS